jgi:hypothetical protein
LQTKGRLFFRSRGAFSIRYGSFVEVLGMPKGEMEGKMEVSVMELYYSVKNCICE